MRIFIFALLTWAALSNPSYSQTADGPIATTNVEQLDAEIANRIREILGELGNYEDVTVVVSDGVVTFRGTTASTAEATELTPLANRIEGVVAVKNEVTETAELVRRLNPTVERFQSRLDQFIIFLPLALIAFCAFALVVFIGFMIARLRQPWDRLAPNAFIADIYRQLVRISFVIFGVVIALDILNATALLGTILGAAGIIGLAIGFAVRDTVENFIASVMLSFRQPFRPNDTVEINGDQGKVIRLTSRATILLSFDGNHIRIPNATVFKSRIINFSQNVERRFKFSLLIDRNCDLDHARTLVTETIQGLPFVVETPAAQCWIENLHTTGAEIVATGWINQHETSLLRAKGEAMRLVKRALQEDHIALVDSSQVVVLQNQNEQEEPAKSAEPQSVAEVEATDERALDAMIESERVEEDAENLLREDALKE